MLDRLTLNLVAEIAHFPLSATAVLVIGFIGAATIGSIAWFKSESFSGWQRRKVPGKNKQQAPGYDKGIVPAEVAARQDREGSNFKQPPQPEGRSDTTSGYTVDREGLVNNYAIEPEIYVEKPGDLKEKKRKK